MVGLIAFYGQDRRDAFTFIQGQQIHHWPASRSAARQGNMKDLQPIHFAEIRKAQDGRVSAGNQQMLNEILVLDRRGTFTRTPSALGLIIR